MQGALLTFNSIKAETKDSTLRVTLDTISEFHDWLVETGFPVATADRYESGLKQIFKRLPKDKVIQCGTLQYVREKLQEEGYETATINLYICTTNRFLEYCGYRELQLIGNLPLDDKEQPELSRSEYLKLLATARRLGKQREYLLIKLFATTGITVSEVSKVTPIAVRQGKFQVCQKRIWQVKHISSGLQTELLNYAEETGRIAGPIFISQRGTVLNRSSITNSISALAEPAGLPIEKCNAICLRRLYMATRQEVAESFEPLINKAYDDIVDKEQVLIGWN